MKHDEKKIEEIKNKWYSQYSNKSYPKKLTDIVNESSDYIAKQYAEHMVQQEKEQLTETLNSYEWFTEKSKCCPCGKVSVRSVINLINKEDE